MCKALWLNDPVWMDWAAGMLCCCENAFGRLCCGEGFGGFCGRLVSGCICV